MKEYRTEYKIGSGLRPTKVSKRDQQNLTYSQGIFPEDGVLKTHEEVNQFVHGLNCAFPYPQVFNLRNSVIICTDTTIYEYTGSVLSEKISGLTPGLPWSIADFYDYLIFSNAVVTVVRDASTFAYAVDSTKYIGSCCLNLNGQLIVGGIKEIK